MLNFTIYNKKRLSGDENLGEFTIFSNKLKPYNSNKAWYALKEGSGRLNVDVIWSKEGGQIQTCTVCAKGFAAKSKDGDRCLQCHHPVCSNCCEITNSIFS